MCLQIFHSTSKWRVKNLSYYFRDVNYPILTPDGDEIGKVAKQFSGVARELITDADNFSVSFPVDLDVKIKAVLFGAVFLIDMMFFEDTNDGSEQIGINN